MRDEKARAHRTTLEGRNRTDTLDVQTELSHERGRRMRKGQTATDKERRRTEKHPEETAASLA